VCRAIGNTDPSASDAKTISIVAVGAVTDADAGFRISPRDLTTSASVTEGGRGIGVTKATVIAIFVAGNDQTECSVTSFAIEEIR
jgi:hypothetical protein